MDDAGTPTALRHAVLTATDPAQVMSHLPPALLDHDRAAA
jgi:hypothetical protein